MVRRTTPSGLNTALALAALLVGSAASAQAYQCRMPRLVDAPEIRPDGPTRTPPINGYTLAASWSPEFCKPRAGQRTHALQCSGRNGSFGVILHGLWPDAGRGWPQWCPTKNRPTGAEISRQLCTTPSARLVARQWAKHGSCMTKRPQTYYKVSNMLWRSIRWPDLDGLSRRRNLTAGQVREMFLAANKGWRQDAIGLKLNERGWLQEFRLCYDKRFRPTKCDRARYGAADEDGLKIWRGL